MFYLGLCDGECSVRVFWCGSVKQLVCGYLRSDALDEGEITLGLNVALGTWLEWFKMAQQWEVLSSLLPAVTFF